jgi:hypothetical protein
MDEALYAQGRWGMALFMGRGFAAWMHAWTQATPAHDADTVCSTRVTAASEAVSLPSQVQSQMVSALAGMVLDALRGEAA